MVLSTSDGQVVATLDTPSSVSHATGIVESTSSDHDSFFRLVVYGSGKTKFLGLVEDVYFPAGKTRRRLTIRNLLALRENAKPVYVRNAPDIGTEVRFASDTDLDTFFPRDKFPLKGYLGFLRETRYPLPFDLDDLCFANTAILAGIKHGKSHLAALLSSQLHLTGKKVLVIDPTGEWPQLIASTAEMLKKNAKLDLSVSSHVVEKPELGLDPTLQDEVFQYPEWWKGMWEALKRSDLAILDVSFATSNAKVEEKLRGRCSIAYRIQQELMRFALRTYGKTKKSYGCPTCIVLEECHQFVPPKALANRHQELVRNLFSMSSKEYRKYGSGHVFIDQSLGAISEDLQIQTFLLGATTTPSDIYSLETRLGRDVSIAAQRTIGGTERRSWVAYGVSTPMVGIPWEIETFKPDELSMLGSSLVASKEQT